MAMTPSQLSIIVKSDGITTAVTNLNNLQVSAKNAEGAVTSLSNAAKNIGSGVNTRGLLGQLASLGAGVNSLISTFNSLTNASSASVTNLTNSLSAAIARIQALETSVRLANAELARLNGGLGDADSGLRRASSSGNIFNNTLRSMATAALAYLGINFAAGIVKEADAWSMMQSKLKLAVGSMELAKSVQGDLYTMSQNLRVPLEDTAKLFTRMSVPLQKMGQTVGDTKKVVEAFSMALKLGGATGQEASSAMLQLSQSFNAGRLNGGEFNSVAEAAPSVLRALEVELVRVGKSADLAKYGLKELAARGVLTTGIMAEALKRAAPKWAEEFKQLPLTVDGAMTRIKNAWQKAVGEMGQETKFNESLAKSLKTIEDMLPSVARAVASAFTFLVDNGEMLLKTLASILAVGALFKTWAVVSAMYSAGAAAYALTGTLAGVRAAMLAIGLTPIGLAITALGVILAGSITLLNKKKDAWEGAKEAADKVKNNGDLIKSMQLETLAMMEQVDVARAKANLPSLYTKEIEEAKKAKQTTDSLTAAKTTAAKVEQDILNWKKNQRGNVGTKIGEGEYYLPKELKDARENAKKLVAQEEEKNKMIAVQQRLGSQQKEAVVKQEMDALAIKYALEAKTGAQKAEAVRKAAIAELEILKSQGLSKQAALDRMIVIEREYQASLDKIKPTKAEQEKIKEAEATEKLTQELEALVKEKALIIALGKDADKLLPAQKELIKMETERASITDLNIQRQKVAQALEIKAIEDKFATQNKAEEVAEKSAKSAQEELKVIEDQIAAFGKIKGSIQESEIARLNEQLTVAKGIDGNDKLIKSLEAEIATREKLKEKTRELAGLKENSKDLKDAQKLMDDLLNPAKVDSWENSMSKGLKGVAKGFVDLSKALDKYEAKQSTISKHRDNYNKMVKEGTTSEIALANYKSEIEQKEFEYKLASYGEMADAAKGFFEEGSKGYRTLDGISKVVHAAQLARNLVEMGQLAVKAVMNQASGDPYSAWARMGAMAAAMAALGFAVGGGFNKSSGGVSAADMQKAQGSGQRMDASTGKYVADGMSVFGDITAKSESITKSLELLKSSYDKLYPVNQGMLKALKNIESSMSGLTNLVVRSGGIVEGSNLGIQEGTIKRTGSAATGAGVVAGTVGGMALGTNIGMGIGAIGGPIGMAIGAVVGAVAGSLVRLWGKTTQNIVDSGLQFGGNLAGLKSGKGFEQYASVNTTKSRAFGLFKETTNKVETDKLNNELSNQFAMIFSNMQTTLEEAGKVLYGSSKGVTDALNNMVFEVSKVSLKGLSGQALTDAINGVISKALDQMAGTAFANLEQFRQVGEGYAQTVIRVANTFSVVNATFDKLGMKLYAMDDAGIKAAMSFSELFDSMEEMQSVASSYYDNFYTEQEKQAKITEALRKQFAEMNLTLPTTSLAYRELVDSTTDPAKIATLWKLSDAFAEVFGTVESGIGGLKDIPQSMRDAFEALAESAERWLNLSKSAADLRGSINEILTGASDNSAKKAEKLWKMLESDISVEQKMSIAGELKDTILAKYQVERDSITKLLDLSRQLKNFVEGLKVGSMSPLTTTQKLEEAKKQYESILAKAKGGDTTAQGALQGSATTYLDLARTALASGTEYRTIFDEITTSLDMFSVDTQTAEERMVELNKSQETELIKLVLQLNTIESVADSYYKTNIAEMTKQLTVMQEMYIKLGNLDGIAVDLAKLPAEIAAVLAGKFGRTTGEQFIEGLYKQYTGKSAQEIDKQGMEYWTEELLKYGRDYTLKAFVDSVKPPTPVVNKPSDTTTILANTVVELKEEIAGLRDDQNKQTDALISATVISNQQNATDVVEGVDDAYNKKNWRDVNAPALV